jgi:tetratricopeptide (TPR) repeat protein
MKKKSSKMLKIIFIFFIPSLCFTQTAEEIMKLADEFMYSAAKKAKIKDLDGAIIDITKASDLWPENPNYPFLRGRFKQSKKEYYGAIAEYNKVIKIQPKYIDAYLWRGLAKCNILDKFGGCSDFTKAANLGSTEAKKMLVDFCDYKE